MLVDNKNTEKNFSNSVKLPLVSIVEDHIKNGQEDQKLNAQIVEDDDDFGEFKAPPSYRSRQPIHNNQLPPL